jgi:hypothetical protein
MLPLLAAAAIAIPLVASHREVSPEGIITVNVKVHYVTEIDFVGKKNISIIPRGEAGPRYGDPSFWGVTVDRNALFIRPDDDPPPVGGGRSTNIIVTFTDGRRIQIHAQEVSLDKRSRPDLKLIAELAEDGEQEFPRMEDPNLVRLVALQAESLALLHKIPELLKPTTPVENSEVDTLNELHAFDYVIDDVKGKGANFRVVLLHNERFLFAFVDGLGVPTISALREKKKYVKVDATWVKNRYELPLIDEGMVQIGKDSFKFHLRSKK